MKRIMVLLLCFSWFLFLISPPISAQLVTGKIVGEGKVYLEKDGKWKRIFPDHPIFVGDKVKVEDGCIQVLFEGDVFLVLHPKTIVKIIDFNFKEFKIRIEKGAMDFKISDIINATFFAPSGNVTTFDKGLTVTDTYTIGAIEVVNTHLTRVCCYNGFIYAKDFSNRNILTINQGENANINKKGNIVVAKRTEEKCSKCSGGVPSLALLAESAAVIAGAAFTIIYYEQACKKPASPYRPCR
ncbi:MAG: hypothetical protein JRI44_09335 [Deltaproteobacteria bacterium]|nr:hypothetical protein [Deltaproteobacteria bacterium]